MSTTATQNGPFSLPQDPEIALTSDAVSGEASHTDPPPIAAEKGPPPHPARLRVRPHRPPPDKLLPPGRRPDRGPELPLVHEAFRYLTHKAREFRSRGRLVGPMNNLLHQTGGEVVRVFLRQMGVDSFDVWIAYYLLSRRERSPRGRDACGWLAEMLGRSMHAHLPHRRDKSGAVMLWAVLHRAHQGTPMFQMYRTATALLIPGIDRFELGPDGPVQIEARPEPVSGDAMKDAMRLLDSPGPESEQMARALQAKLRRDYPAPLAPAEPFEDYEDYEWVCAPEPESAEPPL
jgi:hypothetical protein